MQSGFSNIGRNYVYACEFVKFDISDNVSVNTNILTANNNNVKHLSNICYHLSNVIKECCDISDNKLILVNLGTENIKEIIHMICTDFVYPKSHRKVENLPENQ